MTPIVKNIGSHMFFHRQGTAHSSTAKISRGHAKNENGIGIYFLLCTGVIIRQISLGFLRYM